MRSSFRKPNWLLCTQVLGNASDARRGDALGLLVGRLRPEQADPVVLVRLTERGFYKDGAPTDTGRELARRL